MQSSDVSPRSHLNLESFLLMSFQPEEPFYQLSFNDRLAELIKSIETAQIYFRRNGFSKGIFVAPEYLFKDLSQERMHRYFTHKQKLEFIKALSELSIKQSRLILAPGTICWGKTKKGSDEIYYRNELFFFYQGTVQKYKKTFPHKDYDYEFSLDRQTFNFFKTGIDDASIISIGGLNIAVEICYDHTNQHVTKLLAAEEKPTRIDIHLIVSDGITKVVPLQLNGVLTIKIERKPDPRSSVKNVIGTNVLDATGNVKIVEAAMTDKLTAYIKCYQFVRAPENKSGQVPTLHT